MSDLHELLARHRAVAEAATPGPWEDNVLADPEEPCVYAPRFGDFLTASDVQRIPDAQHIALNDPEVALALNTVAELAEEAWRYMASDWRDGMSSDVHGGKDDVALRMATALTQLHEVMQRKIGDEG